MMLAMGQYDAPQVQKQPIFRLDPYKSNIAVFGAPMSGKTTFIKTLLVRLHEDMGRHPKENIYLIDFGGNIGAYGNLSNVCACVDNTNEENIKIVFRTVEKRLKQNANILDSRSYYPVVTKSPEEAPEHMFLIIENINAFLADERYSAYQDLLIKLCRDGLSKGLTVVITANDTSGIGRLLANFGQKIAFEMPGDSYYDIFNTKVNRPMRLPGRGVVNIDSGVYEYQCFLPFPTIDDEDAMLNKLLEYTGTYQNENRMTFFDDVLTRKNFHNYCAKGYSDQCSPDEVVVGLDYYEQRPVTINFPESRSIAIYGKRQFGKTNLLSLLLEGLRRCRPHARILFVDDGRKQLSPFYETYKNEGMVDTEYFTDLSAFNGYLVQNGYGGFLRPGAPEKPAGETPTTVFVLQAKTLYRGANDTKNLLRIKLPGMISDADSKDHFFIFSDVTSIPDADMRTIFHSSISTAFLLDNIGEFVAEKGGGNKSVFGELDAKELKAEYAQCGIGDGYYYDIDADVLQKLKFIKAD